MRFSFTLACLLIAPAALAAESIHWPSPFSSGTVLTYRETFDDRTTGDDPQDLTIHGNATVRMLPSGTGSGIQRWEWDQSGVEVRQGSETTRRIFEAIVQSQIPAMDVQLDADGRYAGIANVEVLGRWVRGIGGPILTEALAEQLLKGGDAADADEARMLAEEFTSDAMDIIASPEGVEATMSWEPKLFNAWFGGTWEAGRDYTVMMTVPSDTLMRSFPATITYRVTALEGGKAQLAWSTEVEQGRLQLTDTGVIRFDRTSGVPEFFESTRTERTPGETSTSRTTYTLQSAATP